MALWALPVGFRFHPTDEELVSHYLKGKITGQINSEAEVIPEIDICKCEPWDLPGTYSPLLPHRPPSLLSFFYPFLAFSFVLCGRTRDFQLLLCDTQCCIFFLSSGFAFRLVPDFGVFYSVCTRLTVLEYNISELSTSYQLKLYMSKRAGPVVGP
jgi:hypothetical protein